MSRVDGLVRSVDPSGLVLQFAELDPCPKSCEKLGLGFRL